MDVFTPTQSIIIAVAVLIIIAATIVRWHLQSRAARPHPVTPEQIIAKHADDGLYEMRPGDRQAISDLLSLDLSWSVRRSITKVGEDPELSARAGELIAPWARYLRGPARNHVDYRAATTLPEATVKRKHPLTARMLMAADEVDVQVLNALVALDEGR